MKHVGLSFCVAFVLTLSLLLIPAVAPPVALAGGEADLPNPLTVSFSASVSEGANYSFTVVPNATFGSVINQFSRDPMVINVTANNNTPARFFNMSTASGAISGDLSGSIVLKWNRLDFATPYLPAEKRFITGPDGVGLLYLNIDITGTILGDFVVVGVADLDYKGSLVKGEGLVSSREEWAGPPPAPARVLIGELSYQISGGTITGTFTLRNYSQNPVGLEGKINTTMEYLWLEGQLINDESDWITNNTAKFVQFTKDPVTATHRKVLEEMTAGREVDQDIKAGDMGFGGKISLMRTGVLDVVAVGSQDIPVNSVTATRTIENNTGSNKTEKRGVAKTIVLVDMAGFDINTGVNQTAFTFMPSYSYNYMGTDYYAGVESYVIAATNINLTLYLSGPDYRYVLIPTPVVSSVSPIAGYPGQTFEVTINGKWFWTSENAIYNHQLNIGFGAGITADWQNCTLVSDTQVKVNITIAGGAATGSRDVSVTKRGQTGTLVGGFGVGAAVKGHGTLQARPTPPNAQWVVPVTARFFQGGCSVNASVTTDQNGNFSVSGLANGTYDIGVKSPLTTSRLKSGIGVAGITSVDFGTLLSGDVNSDDYIGLDDYTVTVTAYDSVPGSGNWNDCCDFNRDGYVGLDDYTLSVTNYDKVGEMYGMC